jgi:two-component system alkaline phosphatase synthesis response regulator PhoP
MPKILIVDDNPMNCMLLRQTLEELETEGVELLTAEDGESALNTIRDEVPDIVFLDVVMPKMDGHQVCKAIKSDSKLQHIHVIMLTMLDQKEGEDVGVDMYMTKPYSPDKILETARKILSLSALHTIR